jgi:hypothetical protein
MDDYGRFHRLVFGWWHHAEGTPPELKDRPLRLGGALERVEEMMRERHLYIVQLYREEPTWGSRSNLIPSGDTAAERRQDYLDTREKLLHYRALKRGQFEKEHRRSLPDQELDPGPIDWEVDEVGEGTGQRVVLALDCDERMVEAFRQAGHEVESGSIGFTDGVRSLPIPIFEADVIVYDLHDPCRFDEEAWGREDFESMQVGISTDWREFRATMEDEGQGSEEAAAWRESYPVLNPRLIEDSSSEFSLASALDAMNGGAVVICFLNSSLFPTRDAETVFRWLFGTWCRFVFEPTRSRLRRCVVPEPEIWGALFKQARSPLSATIALSRPGGTHHEGDTEDDFFDITPLLTNRKGDVHACMVQPKSGEGVLFMLPEFSSNVDAAVRITDEIWPELQRRHLKQPESAPQGSGNATEDDGAVAVRREEQVAGRTGIGDACEGGRQSAERGRAEVAEEATREKAKKGAGAAEAADPRQDDADDPLFTIAEYFRLVGRPRKSGQTYSLQIRGVTVQMETVKKNPRRYGLRAQPQGGSGKKGDPFKWRRSVLERALKQAR